jgi:hypothetical protein
MSKAEPAAPWEVGPLFVLSRTDPVGEAFGLNNSSIAG